MDPQSSARILALQKKNVEDLQRALKAERETSSLLSRHSQALKADLEAEKAKTNANSSGNNTGNNNADVISENRRLTLLVHDLGTNLRDQQKGIENMSW